MACTVMNCLFGLTLALLLLLTETEANSILNGNKPASLLSVLTLHSISAGNYNAKYSLTGYG